MASWQVDSIAVSAFLVILVEFDKYRIWDEQACLMADAASIVMAMVTVEKKKWKDISDWLQGERARVMQMKNQRFLYPESAAERRQAEDDPLVRDDGDVDDDDQGDGDEDDDGDNYLGHDHDTKRR